jgi:pimeloyl-ACP methyl ester carboxylesterase
MNLFDARDGTRLAYHVDGAGRPLVCLPGGPMQASAYLGDLGGLAVYRQLVRLDLRGTGASAVPADPSTYRCDRQVDDVEALRVQLGRERIDLLGNSGGGTLAVLYAVRYPHRVGQLVLVADAYAALERIWAGAFTDADVEAIAPFYHGRWDEARQAFAARRAHERNAEAADAYYGPGAIDPDAVREALANVDASVLLIAGEYDPGLPPARAAEYAALFPHARLVVQPGAGHFPWLDDPDRFVRTVTEFLL